MKVRANNRFLRGVLCLVGACSLITWLSSSSAAEPNYLQLRSTTPLELIEKLKQVGRNRSVMTVDQPVQNWVRETDVRTLIKLLDSKEPCAPVVLARSGTLQRTSFVGEQAAFLIQGFRSGEYPPQSFALPLTEDAHAEILSWWREYAKSNR